MQVEPKQESSDKEISRTELPPMASSAGTGEPLVRRQYELIRDVKVKLFALLGDAEITVGQLFSMREGEVVPLNQAIDQPVAIQLDGKTVARGELVVVGDNFGLRITEAPER